MIASRRIPIRERVSILVHDVAKIPTFGFVTRFNDDAKQIHYFHVSGAERRAATIYPITDWSAVLVGFLTLIIRSGVYTITTSPA
jgi:hypothetical protein